MRYKKRGRNEEQAAQWNEKRCAEAGLLSVCRNQEMGRFAGSSGKIALTYFPLASPQRWETKRYFIGFPYRGAAVPDFLKYLKNSESGSITITSFSSLKLAR